MPSRPRPIVIIGAGGIVNDAHLPAYRKAGFPIAGIFDIDSNRARAAAEKFSLPTIFQSLASACATKGAVFDVAVPPEHSYEILQSLPDHAAVLIQKPMGRNLADARRIRDLCASKQLSAAVNFQLRFSPMMLALRDVIQRGLIGPIVDLEIRLNLHTRWEYFPFLKKLERVEILVHSVHYLDLIRSLLGEPKGVDAVTLPDPRSPQLRSTRSSMILHYGETVRCTLSINHNFEFGPKHQAATVNVQGVNGAAMVTLGLLLNYPHGEPETLEVITRGGEWTDVPLIGRWFPDGFIGTMANLQRYVACEDASLWTHVNDAFKTMALVEACYQSNATTGTPIPS